MIRKEEIIKDWENWHNYKFCLEAVKRNSGNFSFVPDALKTLEMCLEAVKRNSGNFSFVPTKKMLNDMLEKLYKG